MDQMMFGEHHQVFRVVDPQEGNAPEWTTREIERPLTFLRDQLLHGCFTLFPRQRTQIRDRQLNFLRRMDHLHGTALSRLDGGAIDLMAAQYFSKRTFEYRHVEIARDPEWPEHMISNAGGVQLMHEPQPLLW